MCSIGKVGIGLVGIESVLAWLVLGWLADDGKADLLPVPMHLSAHLVRSELKKPCNADCNHNSYRKIAFPKLPKLIQMQYLFNMSGSLQVLIV